MVGAQLERVRAIEDCLKTTLAAKMNYEIIDRLNAGTEAIGKGQIDNYSIGIGHSL